MSKRREEKGLKKKERASANKIFEDLATALDPVLFAKSVGLSNPDRWQREVLRSKSQKLILNCCRQSGKTTIVSLLALRHVLIHPNSLVLLISPSIRQSTELFRKFVGYYHTVEKTAPIENRLWIELRNGSRVVSLPSRDTTIRCFSPSMIIVDEAARVLDEVYHGALRPMLAVSRGRLVLLSTPFGKRGFFFESWLDFTGQNVGQWEGYTITAEQCQRISAEFLIQERAALGERWFAQEYLCSFEENIDALFRYEAVAGSLDNELEAWEVSL